MLKIDRITGEEAVNGALRSFVELTGRSLLDELKITGRNLAVAMARGTLAVGLTKTQKLGGEKAVARDINRVFLGAGQVYETLEKEDASSAAEFWRAHKLRDESAMERILQASGVGIAVIREPAPHSHWSRKRAFIPNDAVKQRYIQKVQKQVGKAKAGWALAADACGGHRGIPAWASGSRHPDATGGAIIQPGIHPSVTIYNRVSYIEDAMVATSIWETTKIAYEKLLKRVQIITRKHMRETKLAA